MGSSNGLIDHQNVQGGSSISRNEVKWAMRAWFVISLFFVLLIGYMYLGLLAVETYDDSVMTSSTIEVTNYEHGR